MLSVEVGGKLGYLYPPQLLGIHHWFLSCSLPENFVAWARWTKPCGQNTSDSNNDRHYEQKNENLPQLESESTVQKVLNTLLLGFRIRSNW